MKFWKVNCNTLSKLPGRLQAVTFLKGFSGLLLRVILYLMDMLMVVC